MTTLPSTCMVLFVRDVPRMTSFYCTVAAMELLHQESSYAILSIQGFELVIHALYGEASLPYSNTETVAVREDSYTKLCLPVTSIAIARAHANELGGAIKSFSHEWAARGFRACDGHDPEGNVFQVRMLET